MSFASNYVLYYIQLKSWSCPLGFMRMAQQSIFMRIQYERTALGKAHKQLLMSEYSFPEILDFSKMKYNGCATFTTAKVNKKLEKMSHFAEPFSKI